MVALKRRFAAVLCATSASLLAAAPAQAADPCPAQPEVRVLADGYGVLESIAVDRRGRMFFTEADAGQLLMLKSPDGQPRVVAEGIDGPGGIVFKRRDVLVGFGDTIAQAADGPLNPEAGLLRVNPKTGESSVFVEGLQMANGVTRGPGGVIYASADVGTGIDRIFRKQVELGWADPVSPNGLVVDSTGKFLFANQTFTAAAIQRIPLDDPTAATTYFQAGPGDIAGGFDGLARDGEDNLYVAANGTGQILRVSGPGEACSLLQRVPFPDGPSALAFGRRMGKFDPSSLFVVTFGGELIELRNAR